MRDAGTLDGEDLMAILRARGAEYGQLFVARINGDDVTIKRFRQREERIGLLPPRPDCQAMEVEMCNDEMTVEGRVVGVLRQKAT